ncbi:MAG: RdgB/HAM1 family non-canonical purine NTP pyrophosphatase [Sphingobacteriaceae bacterium]
MELVFATNNEHKLEEVRALLGDKIEFKSLADIGCQEDIPETGTTFKENAKQKTDYLVQRYAVNCFGDDSGLEVDALDGEPGVYSARYSGSRDMEKNISLVLEKLNGVHLSARTARFRTVISLYLDGTQYFFEGQIEGAIITSEVGAEGFGYDPIFVPKGYDQTFAQMSLAEKNQISHRAIAIANLITFLKAR